MIRSLKICVGGLVVALLAVSTPAQGAQTISPPDFAVDAQDECITDQSAIVRRFLTDQVPQLEVIGDIVIVDLDNNELVMAFDAGNTTYMFQLDKDCRVMINNEQAQLADLLPGEQAVAVIEVRGFLRFVPREIRCTRD